MKKPCYIDTMEYYAAIKMKTFESVLMKWMNLEPIMQSEVSQKEKNKYCILMHMRRAFLLINKAKSPKFLWLLEASRVCLETD